MSELHVSDRGSRRWALLSSMFVTSLLLPVLAGCSAVSDREDAAAQTALQFHRAIGAGDFDGACRLLTPATRDSLAQDGACAKALRDADVPSADVVGAVGVWGQAAQVAMGPDTVFLTVFDGTWLVRAAGCKPDRPGPYDCSVEAG